MTLPELVHQSRHFSEMDSPRRPMNISSGFMDATFSDSKTGVRQDIPSSLKMGVLDQTV